MPRVRCEGGWAFNPAYDVSETTVVSAPPGSSTPPQTVTTTRHAYPGEVGEAVCPDDMLKEAPFFGPLADASICSSNRVPEISAALRARLLADAIPAESLVAGFTSVPGWDGSCGTRNFDMASNKFKDTDMKFVLSDTDWVHSFFIRAPYSVVHGLYEDLVRQIKEER